MSVNNIPSFNVGDVSEEVRNRLKHLVSPHVDSFDYFLEEGIVAASKEIMPMYVLLRRRDASGLQLPFNTAQLSRFAHLRKEVINLGSESEGESSLNTGVSDIEDRDTEADIVSDDDNLVQLKIHFEDLIIETPQRKEAGNRRINVTPREAREAGITYGGSTSITVVISLNGNELIRYPTTLGTMPIMVGSSNCHLHALSQRQLVSMKEEALEVGGYFIMNGIERVVRLLQVPRRNYATAITRNSYRNRGNLYTDKGVAMRCVRPDQSSITVTLHYLNNGNSTMKFVCRKQEFLLPVVVVLKALAPLSDKEIYERVVCHDHGNSFLTTRLEILLRDAKQYKCTTCEQYRAYLGSLFRQYLPIDESFSDASCGVALMNKYFFVHCSTMNEKVECCIHMLRKLFVFVQNKCCEDNADAFQNHEVLLPGHLINAIFKEKLEDMLVSFKQTIARDFNLDFTKSLNEIQANTIKFCKRHVDRVTKTACLSISKFLNTGNIISSSGLDLQQVSGYTIVAERLNIYRYHSHFQSIHRGQFFANMKTTAVRKLLPESWGFLCPVHTPDGSPCGLLNHLAREVLTVAYPTDKRPPTGPGGAVSMDSSKDGSSSMTRGIHEYMSTQEFKQLLVKIGMLPVGLGGSDGHAILNTLTHVAVSLDGVLIGAVSHDTPANEFVRTLRVLKATFGHGQGLKPLDPSADILDLSSSGKERKKDKKKREKESNNLFVNPFLEIAYFPPAEDSVSNIHAFPGIYMFTSPGRLIRPVVNLQTKTLEYIGPMEQVHMEIACLSQDIHENTSHIETEPSVMLSQIAALTPYSDYNQSPRNMYQCQMGKQTMGTPAHALKMRGSDNKLYRIQNPQAPLVQNKAHRQYGMDNYPNGTNAVVCVIAYTGYDMEDAMIINKSSFERGFGHGCMYKTMVIDLDEEEKKATSRGKGMLGSAMRGKPEFRFDNVKQPPLPRRSDSNNELLSGEAHEGGDSSNEMVGEKYYEHLDIDGLPCEGDEIKYGDVLCVYVDAMTGNHGIVTHKENEKAFVDSVRMLNVGSTSVSSGRLTTNNLTHSLSNQQLCRKVSITLRYPRKPVIGDKFSSRHGQKGTLSVLWPQENMPFSEFGISPDILINPHAFPSRMTIGMLVESLAGKSGASHGMFQDSSPFQFHEEHRVVDYMGEQLVKAGYNYYGSEPLYSGQTGKLMECQIFMGVVYYQRLRHMVSDKSQVRSTGPIDSITRQPVKGRKKHGGIRLGEMERDALLSHGVAFAMQDRLMNCSDTHLAHICNNCGGFLGVYNGKPHAISRNDTYTTTTTFNDKNSEYSLDLLQTPRSPTTPGSGSQANTPRAINGHSRQMCITCQRADTVQAVALPYVYRYLANELAGMGVKLNLKLSQ